MALGSETLLGYLGMALDYSGDSQLCSSTHTQELFQTECYPVENDQINFEDTCEYLVIAHSILNTKIEFCLVVVEGLGLFAYIGQYLESPSHLEKPV